MTQSYERIPELDPLQPKSALQKQAEKLGKARPITWFLVRFGRYIDPKLMRWTNGRVNLMGVKAVVVLHHKGAVTGKIRETPLVYFTDKDNVIMVASKGGAEKDPAWLNNIRANPDVELWIGKKGGPYRARIAEPDERSELWQKATTLYSGFDAYQTRAKGRDIPVVICSPKF